jgi:molecular chaperone DnaK (HSP70)
MRLGVDFGTTRIVVAAADRGNYPLVSFEAPDGQMRDWFPPLAAARGATRVYGWDTLPVVADPDWTVVRSVKRVLREAGPATSLDFGGEPVPLHQILDEMLAVFARELRMRSTLHIKPGERLEVMLGVPANANSNQRFLTSAAFRSAGFEVLGLLNEPSAASIEFGHRDRRLRDSETKTSMLVYDLGGGTFDASLVETRAAEHSVVATSGVAALGGDDFDEILAALALELAGHEEALTPAELFRLYEECREKKEALNPNTRKIVIDLDRVRAGWGEVSTPVAAFYERCRPLIEQTRAVVEELLGAHSEHDVETLYVTGGGSELPPVARILKETFGRRVRRSAYMRSATAIGLAIAADVRSGYRLRDRLTQNFGVWREADAGQNVIFDLLLPGGTELPRPGEPPFRVVRGYNPMHNIGHFRYVEAPRLSADLQPIGDLTVWDEIRFPFDPTLREADDLAGVPVLTTHALSGQWVEEVYTYDSSGQVRVALSNRSAGYENEYSLGRWSPKEDGKRIRGSTAGRSHKHDTARRRG